MQGTIRKQDVEDFKHQLAEGGAYIIEKFNVIQSKKRFIAVNRSYMIQISKWTSITPLEENTDSLPLYSFNFSSFSEVELKRNSDNILTGNNCLTLNLYNYALHTKIYNTVPYESSKSDLGIYI